MTENDNLFRSFFDTILFFSDEEKGSTHTQREGKRKVPLVRSSCMFSFSSLSLTSRDHSAGCF